MSKDTHPTQNTVPAVQTVQPLLVLLERLIGLGLSAGPREKNYRISGVRLEGEAIEMRVAVSGLTALVDGEYPVRLNILETAPASTRFSIEFPKSPGLGRLIGLGVKALPSTWLNDLLGRISDHAFSVQGDTVVLDHRALIRRIGKSAPSRPA